MPIQRIFLSSVLKDFSTFRDAVWRAVDALNEDLKSYKLLKLQVSSSTPAETTSSRKACLGKVAKSDLLVGVYGARYGFVNSKTGLSATEEEFREAQRRGIPVIAMVQDVSREPRQSKFILRVGDYVRGFKYERFEDQWELTYRAYRAIRNHLASRQSVATETSYDKLPSTRRKDRLKRDFRKWTSEHGSLRVKAVDVSSTSRKVFRYDGREVIRYYIHDKGDASELRSSARTHSRSLFQFHPTKIDIKTDGLLAHRWISDLHYEWRRMADGNGKLPKDFPEKQRLVWTSIKRMLDLLTAVTAVVHVCHEPVQLQTLKTLEAKGFHLVSFPWGAILSRSTPLTLREDEYTPEYLYGGKPTPSWTYRVPTTVFLNAVKTPSRLSAALSGLSDEQII